MEITIGNDFKVIIDPEDSPFLLQYKWHLAKARGKHYLRTTIYKPRKRDIYLHHLILGERKFGYSFYFLDGNPLNLQKKNIIQIPNFIHRYFRTAIYSKKTSAYRGVHLRDKNYVAQITFKRKKVYLGQFQNEIDAAISYDLKALELHKRYAITNLVNNPYLV